MPSESRATLDVDTCPGCVYAEWGPACDCKAPSQRGFLLKKTSELGLGEAIHVIHSLIHSFNQPLLNAVLNAEINSPARPQVAYWGQKHEQS